MSYNRILIKEKLKKFLIEDSSFIDVSSNALPKESVSSATIIAKTNGYLSGLEELGILYQLLKVNVISNKEDGDQLHKGDIVAKIEGGSRNILLGERVGLNLMSHMSAITTTTRKFVKIIEDSGKNVKIAGTR